MEQVYGRRWFTARSDVLLIHLEKTVEEPRTLPDRGSPLSADSSHHKITSSGLLLLQSPPVPHSTSSTQARSISCSMFEEVVLQDHSFFFFFFFCSSWLSLIRGPYLGRLFPPAPRLVPPPPGELPPSLQWNVSCRKIKRRLRAEESEPGEVGRSLGRTTEGSSQNDRAWVSDRCSFTLMSTRFYTFFFSVCPVLALLIF